MRGAAPVEVMTDREVIRVLTAVIGVYPAAGVQIAVPFVLRGPTRRRSRPARQDSDASRVYRPLQARPEREIAVVRRTDRSVSALCRRFLELLGEHLAAA